MNQPTTACHSWETENKQKSSYYAIFNCQPTTMRPVSKLTIGMTQDHAATRTILYWTDRTQQLFVCAFHPYDFDLLFPFSLLFYTNT